MLSTPPTKNIFLPILVAALPAAYVIASKPDAQFLWTVTAGTEYGTPDLTLIVRAMLARVVPGWLQQPKIVSSTRAGSTPFLVNRAFAGEIPKCGTGSFERSVPNLQKGVRSPSTMYKSCRAINKT
jgi:hypothetical protein